MMSPTAPNYLSILYDALAEPIGLLLSSPDPQYSIQQLSRARASAHDPELAQLKISQRCPPDGNITIVHQQIEVPHAQL